MQDKTSTTTRVQAVMAACSFAAGTIIACVCLFLIKPIGEISSSAITAVSEFLILAGALLGVKVVFDVKLQQFRNEIEKEIKRNETA